MLTFQQAKNYVRRETFKKSSNRIFFFFFFFFFCHDLARNANSPLALSTICWLSLGLESESTALMRLFRSRGIYGRAISEATSYNVCTMMRTYLGSRSRLSPQNGGSVQRANLGYYAVNTRKRYFAHNDGAKYPPTIIQTMQAALFTPDKPGAIHIFRGFPAQSSNAK